MGNCKYCQKYFEGVALGGHTSRCMGNPNRKDWQKGKSLSKSHRENVSLGQRKFLFQNPDKVPYKLYHSSSMSWPEKFFSNLLIKQNITGWFYNYPNGIYSYDFAFPDLKIDVEIDGSTHQQVNVAQLDKRRDEWSINEGWRVYRIDAKLLYSNSEFIIDELIKFINDDRIFGVLVAKKKEPKHKDRKSYISDLKEERREYWKSSIELVRNSSIDFTKFGWVKEVSSLIGIKTQKVNKWMKNYLPAIYEIAFKRKGNVV